MRTLVILLILAAFLQTTILPIDLVLILLLLRAYIKVDQANLLLAFAMGLLVSYLNHETLGVSSIIYLILVQVVHLLAKTPVSRNLILLIPLIFVCLFINNLASSILIGQAFEFDLKILWESLLALPLYLMLRLWEERFIVKEDFKLKL